MLRVPFTVACCMAAFSPAFGANFWLSSIGSIGTGSAPPSSVGSIPTITHPASATQGTFYIWARPTGAKTLQNWGLKIVSSNTSVASFNTSSVEAYNPVLGNNGHPIVRWEFVDEPTGSNIQTNGLEGVTVFDLNRSGVGIGPASDGIPSPGPDQYADPFYNAANNAWLLASINYTLHGVLGQAAIHLQIGDIGVNHAGESSSATNVVFGLTSDPALNANSQRNTSSATADLFIAVSNTPTADFDGDDDIDGGDFLTWQRGLGTLNGASPQQGDANFDGAINGADLGFWRSQYGQPPPLVAVPEPGAAMLLTVVVVAMSLRAASSSRRFPR